MCTKCNLRLYNLYVNVLGIKFFLCKRYFTVREHAKWILNILLLFGGLILLEDLKRRLVDPVEEPPGV